MTRGDLPATDDHEGRCLNLARQIAISSEILREDRGDGPWIIRAYGILDYLPSKLIYDDKVISGISAVDRFPPSVSTVCPHNPLSEFSALTVLSDVHAGEPTSHELSAYQKLLAASPALAQYAGKVSFHFRPRRTFAWWWRQSTETW